MGNKAMNIVRYARKNMKSFEESPFNEVDSAILNWIGYLHIHEAFDNNFSPKGMSIRDLLKAEFFKEMFDKTWSPKETMDLLVAVVASPRFRNIKIRYYRNEFDPTISLQFSALVYSISDNAHYVSFRGTDWSIAGWKEDLLLLLADTAPAQKLAVQYLNSVGKSLRGALIVGGHSKGGNLAVYASIYCNKKIQDRITVVFSQDGPGIMKKDLEDAGFLRIQNRIQKTIPEASYFGMLFESEVEPKIIRSIGHSVMQHNLISWEVRKGKFVPSTSQTRVSQLTTENMNRWINGLSRKERIILISGMFNLLEDLNIDSIDELKSNPVKHLRNVMRSVNAMENIQKKYVTQALTISVFGNNALLKAQLDQHSYTTRKEVAELFDECKKMAMETVGDVDDDFSLFIPQLDIEE